MVIYKTTNLVNGKIYVGKDSKNNPSYLGSGILLSKAIKKYGRENFVKENICECSSNEELNQKEKFYIELLNSRKSSVGYNVALGGEGNDLFRLTGKQNHNYGLKRSDELKNQIRLKKLGVKTPEFRKRKISQSLRASEVFAESLNRLHERNKKKIDEFDLEMNYIKTWNSIKEAKEYYSIGGISKVCKGKKKQTCGKIFRYNKNGLESIQITNRNLPS